MEENIYANESELNDSSTKHNTDNTVSKSEDNRSIADAIILRESKDDDPFIIEDMKKELADHIVSMYTEYPEDDNIMKIGGVPCLAKGDVVGIKAKQKSGKSLLIAILIAAMISTDKTWGIIKCLFEKVKVIYIDTEMKEKDTQLLNRKALKMAKHDETDIEDVKFINLRKIVDPATILKMVSDYIIMFRPDIVFIDGIVDLLTDFNDVTESQHVMREIISLAETYNCCIVTVLHTNKNAEDHNMRGHLGTISSQKSSHVFECVKDNKSNIVTVKCTDSRHEPVPDFSFGFDHEGIPFNANDLIADMEARQKAEAAAKKAETDAKLLNERKSKIAEIIKDAGGKIKKSVLVKKVMDKMGMSQSPVYELIKQLTPDFISVMNDGSLTLTSTLTPQQEMNFEE